MNYIGYWEGFNNYVSFSLPQVVQKIICLKESFPKRKLLVVWDVDLVLIYTRKNGNGFCSKSVPLHPRANTLLGALHALDIEMILCSSGYGTVLKLQDANIGLSFFEMILENLESAKDGRTKGRAVSEYINSLRPEERHVVFVDDQAHYHCKRGFKEDILASGVSEVTAIQHNEHHLYDSRNKDIYSCSKNLD